VHDAWSSTRVGRGSGNVCWPIATKRQHSCAVVPCSLGWSVGLWGTVVLCGLGRQVCSSGRASDYAVCSLL
jgi:hypothetical protein